MKAQTINLLLVEDNEDQRLGYQTILESEGYAVDTVEDGKQAIEALDKKHYDIIVCDMQMPSGEPGAQNNTAGIAALLNARALQSPYYRGLNSVFIVLTGIATYPNCVAAIKAGAYDYISKGEDDPMEQLLNSCRTGLKEKQENWAGEPDAQFVQEFWDDLVKKYGEVWIAVRSREIIAAAEKLSDLNQKIKENFPLAKAYIVQLKSSARLRS